MVTRREWFELLVWTIILWGSMYLLAEHTDAFVLVRD